MKDKAKELVRPPFGEIKMIVGHVYRKLIQS